MSLRVNFAVFGHLNGGRLWPPITAGGHVGDVPITGSRYTDAKRFIIADLSSCRIICAGLREC